MLNEPIAVEGSQHHVCGVQRVDEVWWKGILLFHCIWPPVKTEKTKHKQKNKIPHKCYL